MELSAMPAQLSQSKTVQILSKKASLLLSALLDRGAAYIIDHSGSDSSEAATLQFGPSYFLPRGLRYRMQIMTGISISRKRKGRP
jgi:hypothetical protein